MPKKSCSIQIELGPAAVGEGRRASANQGEPQRAYDATEERQKAVEAGVDYDIDVVLLLIVSEKS